MQLTALCNAPDFSRGKHTHRFAKTKIFLVMKLTAFFLLILCMQVSAAGHAQRITISGQNMPLKKVLQEIQKQSGYTFFYSDNDIDRAKNVTINARNTELVQVLSEVFEDQPLTYNIIDNTIVVKQKSISNDVPLTPPPIDVHGRVLNEAGDPIPGVTVTVKGTRLSTATNDNGEFILNGVDNNATLIFTGVNVETYELQLNGRSVLSAINLKSKVIQGENVTVIASTGYQTISRERSTGSYNVISKEQLEKPTTNIAQRLIGTTSGLLSRLDENGNPLFQIRGQTSLYANAQPYPLVSQPLVVVDGFPIQGDFSTINPNDVESVTILKDAAASSIWGARSANGVIVVVTKRAKKGAPLRIEVNAFTKISSKMDLNYVRPLASSAETIEYEKLAYANWRITTNPSVFPTDITNAYSLAGIALNEANLGYITAADRDARLAALKNLDNKQQIRDNLLANPMSTQFNINLYGSSDRMSNSLSLMYERNQSNFQETYNRRYMINYRNTVNAFKWLDFEFSGMLLYTKQYNSGVNASISGSTSATNLGINGSITNPAALSIIQSMSPYEMLMNPDGSLANIYQYYWPVMQRFVPMNKFPYSDWSYNPIQEIHNRQLTTEQLNTRIQAGLTFKIMKGLSIDSKGQYELFNTYNRGFFNENTYYVRSTVNQATTWNQTVTPNTFTPNLPKGGILNQNRSNIYSYNWRNQVNFNRVFDKHEINFIAGEEINNIVTQVYGNPTAYGYNDLALTVGTFPNGPGGTFFPIKNWTGSNQTFTYVNSFNYSTERYFSSYANAAYTYNSKYTVSGSFRTDASNLITDDPKYRYAPFWSAGLSWQVYKEDFMKDIEWLDRLNVRFTYGYNGNVDKTTSFRPLIATGATPNIYSGDFTASISSFGNPTLRWEKTGTWNLGFDYSLFKNKLYGKIDLYDKLGKDLIAQLSIPAVNGTTSQKLNNASMTNKGIELELGTYININKDIVWRGNVNFAYNKNKITSLFVAQYAASTLTGGGTGAYVVGMDANTLWRFKYAGFVGGEPSVVGAQGATYNFLAFTPGDGRDYLLNMGTTIPPYTLGFTNSFQVKNFNFSFIITGKFGYVFQTLGFNYPSYFSGRVLPNNKLSEVLNGDPSQIVTTPATTNEPRYYFWDRFHQYLSYLVESASHIRMQEVNLTYTLPRNILSSWNIARLQAYVQGNNLFTILWNKDKEDPEYPMGTMKPMPMFTFGIKCEF